MKVKIRHYEDADAVDFTEIHFSEANALIEWVCQSGGFYAPGNDTHPFHSYQLVYNGEREGGSAYMEIIIGSEEN